MTETQAAPRKPNRFLRRLLRNPLSWLGLIIVLLVLLAALLTPWIVPYPEDMGGAVHFDRAMQPPSTAHWLGTDDVGRDILSRVVAGARPALIFVGVVLGIALAIGISTGLVAGYAPGSLLSSLILRITDIFLAVPPLALALAVTVAFNPSLTTAMVAVAFTWWPWYTRLVYGETLRLRGETYIDAARALGQRDRVILYRHVLPNIVSPILVKATLDISFVILLGSSLSFLGIGAQEPVPDWGAMVARGRVFLPDSWWISTMPGLAIFGVVVGFNLLGDALRDALDVRR